MAGEIFAISDCLVQYGTSLVIEPPPPPLPHRIPQTAKGEVQPLWASSGRFHCFQKILWCVQWPEECINIFPEIPSFSYKKISLGTLLFFDWIQIYKGGGVCLLGFFFQGGWGVILSKINKISFNVFLALYGISSIFRRINIWGV